MLTDIHKLLLEVYQEFQLDRNSTYPPYSKGKLNVSCGHTVSAPIAKHPDPEKPFTVEVDASNNGVGAVLSQRFGENEKMHPVTFFSKKPTPPERNYDVGNRKILNRKILAIKLALKERKHWLECAKDPFTVFTDHKNLAYLCVGTVPQEISLHHSIQTGVSKH